MEHTKGLVKDQEKDFFLTQLDLKMECLMVHFPMNTLRILSKRFAGLYYLRHPRKSCTSDSCLLSLELLEALLPDPIKPLYPEFGPPCANPARGSASLFLLLFPLNHNTAR